MNARIQNSLLLALLVCLVAIMAAVLTSCGGGGGGTRAADSANAEEGVVVGVAKAGVKMLQRQLTVSSELVPFQEIDVYAKESGYVQRLDVDYGSRVKAGQVMAVLEIPELQLQLQQDEAAISFATDRLTRTKHELERAEAQYKVLRLEFDRLDTVAKTQPGLVAQQEVDDAQGKDSASEAQVDASKASLEEAQSDILAAQAKRMHDQVLYDYSKIIAPFAGTVTERYANLGTLMQAGTGSSTQAMPLVRLSQDDLFRLVIPVPESYAHFIHLGDPVDVMVTSLNKNWFRHRFAIDRFGSLRIC